MACDCFGKKIIVYEDEKAIAFLSNKPMAAAHIKIIPKEHYPIMEQVPEEVLSHCFNVANDISKLVFDKLNIAGTNFIINNGLPAGQTESHFSIDLIPRTENDEIGLTWEPKKSSKEELAESELLMKDAADKIFNPKVAKIIEEKKAEEVKSEGKPTDNLMLKQLRRIP